MAKKNVIGAPPPKPVKKLTRKQQIRKYAMWGGGGALLLGLIVWAATRPQLGTTQYAVCKVFAETQLYYPNSMRVVEAEYIQTAESASVANAVTDRVWQVVYTFVGASGESRSGSMRCKFGTDPQSGQMIITAAELDRQPVADDIVAKFNPTIPAVLAMKPSLVLPRALGDDLVALRPDNGENEDTDQ